MSRHTGIKWPFEPGYTPSTISTTGVSGGASAYPLTTPTSVGGASSAAYTVTSGSTITSANLNGWTTIAGDSDLRGKTLTIQGDADITGELTIKGKSLPDRLAQIEQRLAILHPNKKLEEKWERLKSLGDMYRELEAEIIEKEHIWAKLKK